MRPRGERRAPTARLGQGGLAAFLILGASPAAPADALDQWHWRNPLPHTVGIEGLAFGHSRFVGVGNGGWILSSTDGVDWNTTYAGSPVSFPHVIATDTGFLAFGFWDATGILLTSEDGLQWTRHVVPEALWMTDAAPGNGTFVAVGQAESAFGGPFIATSPDGLHWTKLPQPALPAQHLWGVSFGQGQWVAVGDRGLILTSPDGAEWNAVSSGVDQDLKDVTFAGDQFVAVGHRAGTSVVLVSRDGVEWTTTLSRPKGAPDAPSRLDLEQITVGASGWVATGASGWAVFSPDGLSWTEHSLGRSLIRGGLAYGHGRWVAGGRTVDATTALTTALFSSTDGIHWTDHTSGVPSVNQEGLACGKGVLVGVGTRARISRSIGSGAWTLESAEDGVSQLSGVVFAGDRFLALGNQAGRLLLLESQDGRQWTNRAPSLEGNLVAAAQGNGWSVAVAGRTVVRSFNGGDWEISPSTSASNLFDLAFDGTQFIGVGRDGTIQTSPDGRDWTTRASPTTAQLRGIASGNSMLVAVGSGVIVVSSNAIDWTVPHSGEFNLRDVAYGGGEFAAVGVASRNLIESVLLTSADGKQWTSRNLGAYLIPRCLAFDGRSFLIGGSSGAILQSDPVMPDAAPALALRWTGGIQLLLTGTPGRKYRVESTDALGPSASWAPLFEILAEGQPVGRPVDPISQVPRRFFRALASP